MSGTIAGMIQPTIGVLASLVVMPAGSWANDECRRRQYGPKSVFYGMVSISNGIVPTIPDGSGWALLDRTVLASVTSGLTRVPEQAFLPNRLFPCRQEHRYGIGILRQL